jgi:DNA-binding protein HU-beta
MPTQKLTPEIVHAAIEGFESQNRRIDSQIDELRQLLNGGSAKPAAESGSPARKRKISAAGRRRMAAAQKARWAKIRGEADGEPSSAQAVAPKAKRKLSAAGRKAISEATKRRWAVKRAEAAKTSAPTKKTPAKTSSSKPKKKARTAPETAGTSTAQ